MTNTGVRVILIDIMLAWTIALMILAGHPEYAITPALTLFWFIYHEVKRRAA